MGTMAIEREARVVFLSSWPNPVMLCSQSIRVGNFRNVVSILQTLLSNDTFIQNNSFIVDFIFFMLYIILRLDIKSF